MIEKEYNSQDEFPTPYEEDWRKKDSSKCSLSNKTPLFLVDQFSLSLEKSVYAREQLLASKRLKSVGKQIRNWMEEHMQQEDLSLQKKSNSVSDGEPFIERVIKYLTD